LVTQETNPKVLEQLHREVARRRTFAIISHPDAGKTTLTEKLLLYTGALELAGVVRARRNQRHVTSDWMAMEQERGISITASALEMEHRGFRINLLDTPGHQDFSEDTYRTLMAVDSTVMVLDSAKGIEPQTEKLFHICRMRSIPILTFINKLDYQGRDPLDLLDEIERVLGIAAAPMNWPIGVGQYFQGVCDLHSRQVLRFQRTVHGQCRPSVTVRSLDDPTLPVLLGQSACRELHEQVELLAGAGSVFDDRRFRAGELTPVFFGSALNNFGVEPSLEALLELAPPAAREICSGRYQKDMAVYHPRLGQRVQLSRAYRLFAREREPIEEAFPGDVIGVINPGPFTIGDTITAGPPVQFANIPRFPSEHFGALTNGDINRYKQFHKGLSQMEEEGAIQVFHAESGIRREPILAAVGELQFDVVLARLRDEYGVAAQIRRLPFTCARWIKGSEATLDRLILPRRGTLCCRDRQGRPVVLFSSTWELEYCQKENPDITLLEVG
jgi:peptide chain release factor 3